MKRKGFTLIELLAVIVILAVIALITTTVIIKVVENARKNAAKNSALNYLDSVEKYIMYHEVNDTKYPEEIRASSIYQISNKEYTVPDGKTAVENKNLNDILGKIIEGEKPDTGIVEFDKKRKIVNALMVVNNYNVTCTSSTSCNVEEKENGPKTYIVHYDTNGGKETIDDDTYIYGEEGTLTSEEPTRDGYNFLGWSIDKKATKETYKKGATIKDIIESGKEITLYAVWEIKIVSWSEGTEEEIAEMLELVDEGKITMKDTGWKVGDERTVTLGSPVNETVTFVIIDLAGSGNVGPDGKDNTTSGGTVYHALVGQKNSLSTGRVMNSSNTNAGGYNATEMKAFIDGDYTTSHSNATVGKFYNIIIPSSHRHLDEYGTTVLQLTSDVKFTLLSEYEVFGSNKHDADESNYNKQLEYYSVSTNREKSMGDEGSTGSWWLRSAGRYPDSCNGPSSFGTVRESRTYNDVYSSGSQYRCGYGNFIYPGVAPFAAI